MRTILKILSPFSICLVPLLLNAQENPAPRELSSMIESTKKIHRQMLDRPPCYPSSLACLGEGPESLKNLLRVYTISALTKTNGNLKSLIEDLRQIDDAEFAVEMSKAGYTLQRNEDKDAPFAISVKLPSGDIVVTLNRFSVGALARPSDVVIIQAFRKENGGYVLADQTGDDLFEMTDYRRFEFVASPQANLFWLLVQGQVALYMGNLERARLYRFNGSRFSEEWKPEDRFDMTIAVEGTQIYARYHAKRIEYTENCMVEKLQVEAGQFLQLGVINHGECEDLETLK